MSLIVEKTRKNDAFDSQRSVALRRAMAGLAAGASLAGGSASAALFWCGPNSKVLVSI
jgi:hypothetical protein